MTTTDSLRLFWLTASKYHLVLVKDCSLDKKLLRRVSHVPIHARGVGTRGHLGSVERHAIEALQDSNGRILDEDFGNGNLAEGFRLGGLQGVANAVAA